MKLACHKQTKKKKATLELSHHPLGVCLVPALEESLTSPGRRQQQVGAAIMGWCSR